jgi:hypothetical protein
VPLVVPKATALCKLLGLEDDLFCVRRADLVRKATDELAWGLSWYVLFTMTISAAQAASAEKKTSKALLQPKVKFDPGNLFLDEHGEICKNHGPKLPSLEVIVTTELELHTSWQNFTSTLSRLDLRVLLSHVAGVNRNGISKCIILQQ